MGCRKLVFVTTLATCLQVPAEIAAGEEKRQGVFEVEVVFALPTNKDATPSPDTYAHVLASIPIGSCGFR
jgi:hypothetical protein